jgi:hypothetical protein
MSEIESTIKEELHPELHWPPSDILVAYDSEKEQIIYTAISAGKTLMIWNVKEQRKEVAQ